MQTSLLSSRPPSQHVCPPSGTPRFPAHAQADEFSFRLPGLGSLTQLRVGHDGRKDWHLERLEVVDTASGTTHYFPCDKARGGAGMTVVGWNATLRLGEHVLH